VAIIGLDPDSDESAWVRELFASIDMSERVRLYILCKQLMGKEARINSGTWADDAPDGNIKSSPHGPVPIDFIASMQAMAAKNGKR